MFPSKSQREDKPRGVRLKKTTPKRKRTPTNFHKSVSLCSSRSWKVLEYMCEVLGGDGRVHCSSSPPPLYRVVLRFWSQKDLAFCIPSIPTSVPPRLLIIAACSLHNHFTAREHRGSSSDWGTNMRHVWLGLMEIVEIPWLFFVFLPTSPRTRILLWWARNPVRKASFFCFFFFS